MYGGNNINKENTPICSLIETKILTFFLIIDKINFPQEQRMMLNAKIQVQVDLQKEFQQIIDSNTESFNQQMVQDMKKCVMKAQKEHGIQMAREKNIIDNMKFSQDWFTQVYKLLKQVCSEGFINAEFDFKEFQEILGCVKN